jgi:pilus assembly protein CpaB
MRRAGHIFLLAVVLGALSAALVYRRLRAQQQEIEAVRRATAGATVALLVASQPIPIGTRIDATHVRQVAWPVDLEPEGAVRTPEAVVGALARVTIERHQPLLESQVVREGAGLLPLIIEEGKRAMSVKVDNVTGVSGFITPNSRVDVLVAGKPDGNGAGEQRSKLILQNVKVLATGTSIERRDDKPVEVPTVTLLVTPEDAEKLTLAARQEPVRLALRNYRDENLVATPGISTVALFKGPVPTRAPRKAPVAGGPRYSVEVLLGEKSTTQALF